MSIVKDKIKKSKICTDVQNQWMNSTEPQPDMNSLQYISNEVRIVRFQLYCSFVKCIQIFQGHFLSLNDSTFILIGFTKKCCSISICSVRIEERTCGNNKTFIWNVDFGY